MTESFDYRELKKNPEARDYRDAMAKALNIARKYDGSEDSYHQLIGALETVEEGILTSPSLQESSITTRDAEAALSFAPKHPREVNDVLDIADASLRRVIHRAVENPETNTAFVMNHIQGVLLSPGVGGISVGDETRFEKAGFEPRLEEVMSVLKSLGIFLDDIIVTTGDAPEGKMREVSYVAIDIPRLDRMILVCNQFGEATFVLGGRVPVSTLLTTNKERLPEISPNGVVKVVKNHQWAEKLAHALTHSIDGAVTPRKMKIDVRAEGREVLRAELLRKYPTSADWMGEYRKNSNQGSDIEALGHKLTSIATRFGVTEEPRRLIGFIELGTRIYGKEDAVLQAEKLRSGERTAEEWKKAILKKYPTFSSWFKAYNERAVDKEGNPSAQLGRCLFVDGRGIGFLAIQFGMHQREHPYVRANFLQLSKRIYGEQDPDLLAAERRFMERAPEGWRLEIRKKYPSAKDLFHDGFALDVLGRGPRYLATQFGITLTTRKELVAALAEVVYGSDDATQRQFSEQTPEKLQKELRKIILKDYPTSREWMEGYYRRAEGEKRYGLSIQKSVGHGLPWLAARFGTVERATSISLSNFIELGLKIYGEADLVLLAEKKRLERSDESEWRRLILKEYPTSAQWMAQAFSGFGGGVGGRISIDRRGVNYIAARFGFETPIKLRGFIELGLKIYGVDDPLLKMELLRIGLEGAEGWRPKILKKYPTSADWFAEYRRSNQGKGIDVNGRGVTFLGTQFGITDAKTLRNFITLAGMIYGEDDPTVRRERERLEKK